MLVAEYERAWDLEKHGSHQKIALYPAWRRELSECRIL